MHFTASALLLFIAACNADTEHGNTDSGYHTVVGIPTAKRIKAREDRIHSEAKTRIYKGGKVFGIISPATYAFFGGLIINTVNRTFYHHLSVCGSSLLTSKRLVTAAHCWVDGHVTATHMTVVLGSVFLFYGGKRMRTSEVFTHPNWNTVTLHNDIAIIYLPNKVNFDINEDYDNSDGPSLRTVVVQLISNGKCWKQLFYAPTTEQLCSSGAEGKGPCYGDSGGPLVTYTNRKFLVGITSHMEGLVCGQKPNIFTRVDRYMDFLASHVKIPKFEFHFVQPGDGQFFENITVHYVPDIE